jgi:hypothetical protein
MADVAARKHVCFIIITRIISQGYQNPSTSPLCVVSAMAKEGLGKKAVASATPFSTQPSIMDISFDPETLEPQGPSSIVGIVEKRALSGVSESRHHNQFAMSSSSPPRRQSLLSTASSFYVLPEAGDSSSLASVSSAVAMLRHMHNEQVAHAKSQPQRRYAASTSRPTSSSIPPGENTTHSQSAFDQRFVSLARPLTASSGSFRSNSESDDSDEDSVARSVASSIRDASERPHSTISTASASSESSLGSRSLRPASVASQRSLSLSRPHSRPARIHTHFDADPSVYAFASLPSCWRWIFFRAFNLKTTCPVACHQVDGRHASADDGKQFKTEP